MPAVVTSLVWLIAFTRLSNAPVQNEMRAMLSGLLDCAIALAFKLDAKLGIATLAAAAEAEGASAAKQHGAQVQAPDAAALTAADGAADGATPDIGAAHTGQADGTAGHPGGHPGDHCGANGRSALRHSHHPYGQTQAGQVPAGGAWRLARAPCPVSADRHRKSQAGALGFGLS
jgi:hypothetical protein